MTLDCYMSPDNISQFWEASWAQYCVW